MNLEVKNIECKFEFEVPLFMGMNGNGAMEYQRTAMKNLIESQGMGCIEKGLNAKIICFGENRNLSEVSKNVVKICEAARYAVLNFQENSCDELQLNERIMESNLVAVLTGRA